MRHTHNRIPLFCIMTSLFWFSMYSYVPTFSTYTRNLGASYTMTGIILGSYGFTQMLMRIPLGIISDRLNMRKLFITAGIMVSLLSALILRCFENIGLILAARSMAGIAAASWVVFTVLYSSYYTGMDAPKATGILNSFSSGGQMAAIFIGGAAAQFLGPRYPFLIGGIAAAAALFLSFGVIENRNAARKRASLGELLEAAKNPSFIMICLLAVLSQFVTFATVYGFTPVVAENIGANDFQLGLLTGISTLPGIFASAMSGAFFAKRFGEKTTIIAGFITVTLTTICIPYITVIWALNLTQFIGGFGSGLVFPLLMGLSIKNVSEDRRATAMGFFQAIYGIGMFLGPLLAGQLTQSAGLKWSFWFTGGVAALGIAAMIFYRRENKV